MSCIKASYLSKVPIYGGKCSLCGEKNHPYMVNNELWQQVFPDNKANFLACLFCFEDRLGRCLRSEDFTNFPINHGMFGFESEIYTKLKCNEENNS